MNIFYLSKSIQECVEMHVSKHCIKMCTEMTQLLSTAHRVLDGEEYTVLSAAGRRSKAFRMRSVGDDEFLYKATHLNHPSAIWARSNRSCYEYLHKLTVALCKEYTYRYGKVHKCESSGLLDRLATPPMNIKDGEFTEPPPAMPDEYIVVGDSVESYRRYYMGAKRHIAEWKNRSVPYWYK